MIKQLNIKQLHDYIIESLYSECIFWVSHEKMYFNLLNLLYFPFEGYNLLKKLS